MLRAKTQAEILEEKSRVTQIKRCRESSIVEVLVQQRKLLSALETQRIKRDNEIRNRTTFITVSGENMFSVDTIGARKIYEQYQKQNQDFAEIDFIDVIQPYVSQEKTDSVPSNGVFLTNQGSSSIKVQNYLYNFNLLAFLSLIKESIDFGEGIKDLNTIEGKLYFAMRVILATVNAVKGISVNFTPDETEVLKAIISETGYGQKSTNKNVLFDKYDEAIVTKAIETLSDVSVITLDYNTGEIVLVERVYF